MTFNIKVCMVYYVLFLFVFIFFIFFCCFFSYGLKFSSIKWNSHFRILRYLPLQCSKKKKKKVYKIFFLVDKKCHLDFKGKFTFQEYACPFLLNQVSRFKSFSTFFVNFVPWDTQWLIWYCLLLFKNPVVSILIFSEPFFF